MREICTSGSVGGLGGATTQAYPAGEAASAVAGRDAPQRALLSRKRTVTVMMTAVGAPFRRVGW